MTLSGFGKYLNWPTQPGRTFLDELRGRVRVIACLEDEPYVAEADQALKARMCLTPEDTAVLFSGPDEDLITAAKEICIRIQEAFQGIPPETRQAMPDCTTDFERILPGADRMYPDTDLPPQPIPPDTFEKLSRLLPKKPWERRLMYRRLGLSEHLTDRLLNLELCDLYDALIMKVEMKPAPLASLLADRMRGSKRAGRDWMGVLGREGIASAIVWLSEKGVTARGAASVLDRMCLTGPGRVEEAFEAVKPT
jgi:glutamyl-tRNA(Gln) amidotransferase subunit E